MASTRDTLFGLVKAALETITTGNGYNNTVTVLELDPPEASASGWTGGPWVVLGIGSEEMDESTAGGLYTTEWTLEIDGYVVTSDTKRTDLLELSQDIRGALLAQRSTITANDVVREVRLAGSEYGEGLLHESGGLAQVKEYLTITYKTRGSF